MEKPGRADWERDSQHLAASQMLAQDVPCCTNPSVIWHWEHQTYRQPSLRTEHLMFISCAYHSHTKRVAGACSPSLNPEHAEERDETWFKSNGKSACEMQWQENKQLLVGLSAAGQRLSGPSAHGGLGLCLSHSLGNKSIKKKNYFSPQNRPDTTVTSSEIFRRCLKKKLRISYLGSNRIAEMLKKSYGLCPVPAPIPQNS